MTAHDSAIGKAKSSAPETELIDIGEQARLSARRRERPDILWSWIPGLPLRCAPE